MHAIAFLVSCCCLILANARQQTAAGWPDNYIAQLARLLVQNISLVAISIIILILMPIEGRLRSNVART